MRTLTDRDLHVIGTYMTFISFNAVCIFHLEQAKVVTEFRKPTLVGNERARAPLCCLTVSWS